MAAVEAANTVAGYPRYTVEESGTELVIVARGEFPPHSILTRTPVQLPYELDRARELVYTGARRYATKRPALVARLAKKTR